MANRERGEVSVTVNGRDFTLVLNTAAMAAIEERLSTPQREVTWDEFWARVVKGSVRACVLLIWGMSRKYHPDLTPEGVQEMVDDGGGLHAFLRVVESAQMAASPDQTDAKSIGLKPTKSDGKKKNP